MQKTFIKKIAAGAVTLGVVTLFALPVMVGAQNLTQNYGLGTGFNEIDVGQESDLYVVIARIVNVVLGFLGVIAVLIILAGGFKWMTAGGNEDKVSEARNMIIQGVIGLFVIFAAWGIASFVIQQLRGATS